MNGLFPDAVGTTTVATAATPAPSEPDYCQSPSSPPFRAAGGGAGANEETDSGSSSSASSSSRTADDFTFSISGQQSPSTSTTALCFGAGGAGMRLWSSSKALARASNIHREEGDRQAAALKGDAVWRYLRRLRRISRRLKKARAAANKETPTALRRRGAVVDDTARERAEAVASAIAHCKETLRRGGCTPRRLRRIPPPLSSLSLDLWLHDRQDEIIASARAAAHCDDDECGGSRSPPCAAAVFLTALARHDAPCMRLPRTDVHGGRESAAAAAGTPSSSQISGPVTSREVETRGSFSELEFLETFDGDEELIDRHFITVQI